MHPHQLPQRVFNVQEKKQAWASTHLAPASLLVVLLVGGCCMQGWRWFADSTPSEPGTYTPLEPRFLGRNFKLRLLEQQLVDKENEIKYLQYQVEKADIATKLKDTNMAAQDAMIKKLQERADNEKIARTKAQLALAEKASELNECNIQRQGLQAQVEECGNEVMALSHRKASGQLISTGSNRNPHGIPHQTSVRRGK